MITLLCIEIKCIVECRKRLTRETEQVSSNTVVGRNDDGVALMRCNGDAAIFSSNPKESIYSFCKALPRISSEY